MDDHREQATQDIVAICRFRPLTSPLSIDSAFLVSYRVLTDTISRLANFPGVPRSRDAGERELVTPVLFGETTGMHGLPFG
jgi:hypothetical protein